MSLSWAQNIFMPANIYSITINIFLEGNEKIKTEKMTTNQSEQSRDHLQVEWLSFFPQ